MLIQILPILLEGEARLAIRFFQMPVHLAACHFAFIQNAVKLLIVFEEPFIIGAWVPFPAELLSTIVLICVCPAFTQVADTSPCKRSIAVTIASVVEDIVNVSLPYNRPNQRKMARMRKLVPGDCIETPVIVVQCIGTDGKVGQQAFAEFQ